MVVAPSTRRSSRALAARRSQPHGVRPALMWLLLVLERLERLVLQLHAPCSLPH